jgi:hypothetical protein
MNAATVQSKVVEAKFRDLLKRTGGRLKNTSGYQLRLCGLHAQLSQQVRRPLGQADRHADDGRVVGGAK